MDYDDNERKLLRWISNIIALILLAVLCVGQGKVRKDIDELNRTIVSNQQSIMSMLDSINSTETKELDDIKRMTFISKTPRYGLMEALKYYDVEYPEWVYCQAILETSLGAKGTGKYNNLFGMKVSTRRYKHFDHWWESVQWYRDKIQYKFNPAIDKDYPSFLKRIGYAEDPNYIKKLTKIHSKLFDND